MNFEGDEGLSPPRLAHGAGARLLLAQVLDEVTMITSHHHRTQGAS